MQYAPTCGNGTRGYRIITSTRSFTTRRQTKPSPKMHLRPRPLANKPTLRLCVERCTTHLSHTTSQRSSRMLQDVLCLPPTPPNKPTFPNHRYGSRTAYLAIMVALWFANPSYAAPPTPPPPYPTHSLHAPQRSAPPNVPHLPNAPHPNPLWSRSPPPPQSLCRLRPQSSD